MKILGIETSCDETSVAIVEDGNRILSHVIASQIKAHRKYGGVMPELASRMHTEKINDLLALALKEAQLGFNDLDACAVTVEPGLEGSLLVGKAVAKMITNILEIPLIPIDHMKAHIYAHFLSENPPEFPFIALTVSGGHTQLVSVKNHQDMEILGETRDDAAGEAFDKVARLLGLKYPGGPEIEKAALEGNPKSFSFPRAMKKQGYDFSFSGLKTAVLQCVKSEETQIQLQENPALINDLAASFQEAVIDVLIDKSFLALKNQNINRLLLSGGVSANQTLTQRFRDKAVDEKISLHTVPPILCTDNAAMVASRAFYQLAFTRSED